MKILRLGRKYPSSNYSNHTFMYDAMASLAEVDFIDLWGKDPNRADAEIKKALSKKKYDLIHKDMFKRGFDTLKITPLYKHGIPISCFIGDCHSRLNSNILRDKQKYHKFNFLLVNNASTIPHFKRYMKSNVKYIHCPWAYNPTVHRSYGSRKKLDACIPAGNMKIPIRKKIHNHLINTEYRYKQVNGLSPSDYGRTLSSTKIVISTCQNDDVQYHNGSFIGMTFNKFFEAPMCGSLHIGQRPADAELFGFKDGHNAVMFDTFDEFVEKFNYYIKHGSESKRIIANSIENVKHCTYTNRMTKILDEIKRNI